MADSDTGKPPQAKRARYVLEKGPSPQQYDEVRITTVPRFKDSPASGSEWRYGTRVALMRKGRVLHTERYNGNVVAAASELPSLVRRDDIGWFNADDFYEYCQQQGCTERATRAFAVLKEHCRSCGGERDTSAWRTPGHHVRIFCDEHAVRGSQGIDDGDDNYKEVDFEQVSADLAAWAAEHKRDRKDGADYRLKEMSADIAYMRTRIDDFKRDGADAERATDTAAELDALRKEVDALKDGAGQ